MTAPAEFSFSGHISGGGYHIGGVFGAKTLRQQNWRSFWRQNIGGVFGANKIGGVFGANTLAEFFLAPILGAKTRNLLAPK